jgi:hypothetical protein
MEGQEVVTSDDHKLGTVITERDDCVIVETGHVFKSKHAIPRSFLHEHEGMLRATVTKEFIEDTPKIDLEQWNCEEVRLHYGLDGPFEVDPDPDGLGNAETEGLRHGVTPAPAERLATLGGETDPAVEKPAVFERQGNAYDPAGNTANMTDRKPREPEQPEK